jgi:hypothetical protein
MQLPALKTFRFFRAFETGDFLPKLSWTGVKRKDLGMLRLGRDVRTNAWESATSIA